MRRLILLLAVVVGIGALAAPALAQDEVPKKRDVFLYVDTVNGSRPSPGTARRPVSCTQTSTFGRGEQLVWRIWGTESSSQDVLSTANVKYAYVTIPGSPAVNLKLNWGPHGSPSNRVWFWTAAWNVPADFPLGTATFRVVFKTEDNKFGRYLNVLTIGPSVPQTTAKTAAKVTTKAAPR